MSDGDNEDEGELKLTGNVFEVVDEETVSHQYTVTLESVLMGKTKYTFHQQLFGQIAHTCTALLCNIDTLKRLKIVKISPNARNKFKFVPYCRS